MVRSALTAALSLVPEAAPASVPSSSSVQPRPALSAPHSHPAPAGVVRPTQSKAGTPVPPQANPIPQVAKAPSLPTVWTTQLPAGHSSARANAAHASSSSTAAVSAAAAGSGQAPASSSLTALLGQPLPHSPNKSQPAVTTAAVQPGAPAAPATAAAGLAAAASNGARPAATPQLSSINTPQQVYTAAAATAATAAFPAATPAVSTAHAALAHGQPQHVSSAVPQAVANPQAAAAPVSVLPGVLAAGLHSSVAMPAVPVLHTSAQQGQPPHLSATAAAHLPAMAHASHAQSAASSGPALASSGPAIPSVGLATASGSLATPSVGQPARVGMPAVGRPLGPGQVGAAGQGRMQVRQRALVGDDVWQLASDVMAAGATATTAAAVTTAAQQVSPWHGVYQHDQLVLMIPQARTQQGEVFVPNSAHGIEAGLTVHFLAHSGVSICAALLEPYAAHCCVLAMTCCLMG